MTSFFGRLKGNAGPGGQTNTFIPSRRDPNAPHATNLEKLVADVGPVRTDGSDKFFGLENFGSTCYANSIIQCLYYSVPFRECVINFPTRAPRSALPRTFSNPSRHNTDNLRPQSRNDRAHPSNKSTTSSASTSATSPARRIPTNASNQGSQGKQEDKDSSEYKKKMIIQAGPVLSMDFDNSGSYGMPGSLFTSLKDIFEAVISHRSRTGVISPHKFLEILRKDYEMFRTPMHQDAHEFLNLLLNEVVENVEQFAKEKREDSATNSNGKITPSPQQPQDSTILNGAINGVSKNSRWVHELFEGILTSETRCLTCENTSRRDESFLDLSVDLAENTSVTSCLRKFSEEEMLCERNKFHCDNCGGLQEAEKRMKIKRLPRILALHLKRFKYTEDLQRLQKLFHRVVFPYQLRLFNTTDDAEDPDRLYELYAVVVHIGGGPYHGHYVSIIKTQDQGWLLFDDEMVEPVSRDYVTNFFGGSSSLACAYVLFYQETTLEAVRREQESEGAAADPFAIPADADSSTTATPIPIPKQNGFAVGGGSPVHSSFNPTPVDDVDQFDSLDRAATISPKPDLTASGSGPRAGSPLKASTGVGTGASPPTPPLSPTLRHEPVQSRKERLREEKERRITEKGADKEQRALEKARLKAEHAQNRENHKMEKLLQKEREKQARERSKEMEKRRRDALHYEEGQMRKAHEENKARLAHRDDARDNGSRQPLVSGPDRAHSEREYSNMSSVTLTTAATELAAAEEAERENRTSSSGFVSSSLNRFRNGSRSLRQKPKFWLSNKDKDLRSESSRDMLNIQEEASSPGSSSVARNSATMEFGALTLDVGDAAVGSAPNTSGSLSRPKSVDALNFPPSASSRPTSDAAPSQSSGMSNQSSVARSQSPGKTRLLFGNTGKKKSSVFGS